MSGHSAESDTRPCGACNVDHGRMTWNSLGMVCARCNQHTGDNHQGHYWGLCKVRLAQGKSWKEAVRDFHFCCPENCELEADACVTSPTEADS